MNNWNMNVNNNGFNSRNFGAPHYDIIQVNGRAGAESFAMGPNSRYLLLDANEPIIWLVQTDGAGFMTTTPFSYAPYVEPAQISLNDIQNRLIALEEKLNAQSNSRNVKQRKNNNNNNANEQSNESTEATA